MTMVSFIETVRNQLTNTSQFPLVVHCSAGVGRTGTFIALWNLMDSASDQHMVDVPATVKRLRDSRYKMVQTADQYKFIYHAIAIASQGSLQRLSADNLDALQMMNIHHSRQLLQTLSSISERFDDLNELSSQPGNSNKNRHNAGPFYPEHTLALISTFLPPEGNTYINAAFVDTSLQKWGIIVTQAPLHNTIADFWTLVWDQKVGQIIMLNDSSVADAPSYWPTEPKGKFGIIEVEVLEVSRKESRIITHFQLTLAPKRKGLSSNEKSLNVKHIQILYWPERQPVPSDLESFYHLFKRALHFQRENRELRSLVHCADGRTKCGIFLGVFNLLQRIEEEGSIHLPWSILTIRETHKHFLNSVEQLECCYKMAEKHVSAGRVKR